eukprot:TRINITY_DN24063_c0_g1_i1.p1 TRINITY_DN24063_c0_g1~~TRINITY_DN24063_c0_g1_i1.p1  ORF type:complete len:367 (+),score=51.45 TRINITY_DN24063_c0_g1_i1:1-1101(+)
MLEQFKGCMLGGLVGDCLGANFECRYESLIPKEKIDDFFSKLKSGSPEPKINKYTDDTAMAKQIGKSFIAKKEFDYQDIADRFSREYYAEPWRGYGGSVVEVFSKLKKDSSDPFKPASQQFNGSGSYGNGAGMRAHPIGLAASNLSLKEVTKHASNIGRITHAHQLGVGGGILQALAVHQALRAESPMALFNILKGEIAKMEEGLEETDYTYKLRLVEESIEKPDSDLAEIGFELGNDVSAIESVPTAFFCFLRAASKFQPENQFEQTIRLAIHLGGDTDTIASMAGAISGAYLGIKKIPEYLYKFCESTDEVIQQGIDIYNIVYNVHQESASTNERTANREASTNGNSTVNGDSPPPEKMRKLDD